MEKQIDEWISAELDSGDELIAKVKGKKLSEFTKDEKNAWLYICAEIGGFEDDKRMSKETQARYKYWFSGDWYEHDPAYDIQVKADIEKSFKVMQEVEEWEKENKNRIVKVRYGDLIRISKILRMEGDHMEDDPHRSHIDRTSRDRQDGISVRGVGGQT
jgi:hypothetical protein